MRKVCLYTAIIKDLYSRCFLKKLTFYYRDPRVGGFRIKFWVFPEEHPNVSEMNYDQAWDLFTKKVQKLPFVKSIDHQTGKSIASITFEKHKLVSVNNVQRYIKKYYKSSSI